MTSLKGKNEVTQLGMDNGHRSMHETARLEVDITQFRRRFHRVRVAEERSVDHACRVGVDVEVGVAR